jgi:hypothetical protein
MTLKTNIRAGHKDKKPPPPPPPPKPPMGWDVGSNTKA